MMVYEFQLWHFILFGLCVLIILVFIGVNSEYVSMKEELFVEISDIMNHIRLIKSEYNDLKNNIKNIEKSVECLKNEAGEKIGELNEKISQFSKMKAIMKRMPTRMTKIETEIENLRYGIDKEIYSLYEAVTNIDIDSCQIHNTKQAVEIIEEKITNMMASFNEIESRNMEEVKNIDVELKKTKNITCLIVNSLVKNKILKKQKFNENIDFEYEIIFNGNTYLLDNDGNAYSREETEDIMAEEIEYNGHTYLLDKDKNVYSIDTNEIVGKLNVKKDIIIFNTQQMGPSGFSFMEGSSSSAPNNIPYVY